MLPGSVGACTSFLTHSAFYLGWLSKVSNAEECLFVIAILTVGNSHSYCPLTWKKHS